MTAARRSDDYGQDRYQPPGRAEDLAEQKEIAIEAETNGLVADLLVEGISAKFGSKALGTFEEIPYCELMAELYAVYGDEEVDAAIRMAANHQPQKLTELQRMTAYKMIEPHVRRTWI